MNEEEQNVYDSVKILQDANKIFIADRKNDTDDGLGEWIDILIHYKTCDCFLWIISDYDTEPYASLDNVYEASIEVDGFDDEHKCTFVGLDTDSLTKKLIEIMDGLAYEA